jgi:general secretion pathway protein G
MKLVPFKGKARISGITLIEIIIVIAIMATVMAYLATQLTRQQDEALKDSARLAMNQVGQALQLYRVHNAGYPSTSQGIDALLANPGNARSWRGPYIERNKTIDPWGTQFGYESDGRDFTIISAGPDRQFGTADDIFHPERD